MDDVVGLALKQEHALETFAIGLNDSATIILCESNGLSRMSSLLDLLDPCSVPVRHDNSLKKCEKIAYH